MDEIVSKISSLPLNYSNLKHFFGLFGRLFGQISKSFNGDLEYIVGVTPGNMGFYALSLGFTALVAYLLGSINFAIIISKIFYREDIRTKGSGNAGMTNILRTYGKLPALFTLLLDMLKAALPVIAFTLLLGEPGGYVAGLFCIVGHAFPIYFKFKGGKGVATAAAMLLCLEWSVTLLLLVLFVGIVLFSRYISLGSIIGIMAYPIILNRMYSLANKGFTQSFFVMLISFLIAALIVFLHRGNIKRILNHSENKISFKKKTSVSIGTPMREDDNEN